MIIIFFFTKCVSNATKYQNQVKKTEIGRLGMNTFGETHREIDHVVITTPVRRNRSFAWGDLPISVLASSCTMQKATFNHAMSFKIYWDKARLTINIFLGVVAQIRSLLILMITIQRILCENNCIRYRIFIGFACLVFVYKFLYLLFQDSNDLIFYNIFIIYNI